MSDLKPSGFAAVGTLEDNRNIKALQNEGNEVTMGLGVPRQAEGKVGDITVRQIASIGLICYIKTNSGWYDINSLGGAGRVEWRPMVLSGSWVQDTTFDDDPPKYFKDSNGFVHLRGKIETSGSDTATITTMPPGFRPSTEIWRFVVRTIRPASTSHIGCIKITSTGVVAATNGALSSDALMDLEGISYYASQKVRGYGGGSSSGPGTGDGSAGGNVTH